MPSLSLYIPIHADLPGHIKFKRFHRAIGVTKPCAIGHLVSFWLWVMAYFPNGYLEEVDPADISEESLFDGDPVEFVDALLTSGFLERIESGYRVVNWEGYGGKLIKRRAENASRKQKERMSRGCHADVTPMSRARGEERRKEENIEENKKPLIKSESDLTGDRASEESHSKPLKHSKAEQIYAIYPRKVGKGAAIKAIEKALKTVPFETLLEAVRTYSESQFVKTAPPDKIPHPATWFNQSRWDDDRNEWNRPYSDFNNTKGRNGGNGQPASRSPCKALESEEQRSRYELKETQLPGWDGQ